MPSHLNELSIACYNKSSLILINLSSLFFYIVLNVFNQIIHSKGAIIGTVRTTVYSNKSNRSNRETRSTAPRKNKEITALKNNPDPVLEKDINVAKDHIKFGDGWQDTFIELGFSQSEISQHEYRFYRDFNGLIGFLLLDWKQTNGKKATVSTLANVLWNNNQHDALIYWSAKYDVLHKMKK